MPDHNPVDIPSGRCEVHDQDLYAEEGCAQCVEDSLRATEFPQAGRDLTPTTAQLALGKIGNGSWKLTDGSVQAAYAEVHQQKKEDQDERREFFNERAKDGLVDAIDLHHRLIKQGQKVMDKLESDDPEVRVNHVDLAILGKAQSAAKELTDRAAGKAKTSSDTVETTTGLAFLLTD